MRIASASSAVINPHVAAAQLRASLALSPVALIGGAFNAGIATLAMWSSGYVLALLAWFGTTLLLSSSRYLFWLRHRNLRLRNVENVTRHLWGAAGVSGSIWGAGMALAATVATPAQFHLLTVLTGGMMGGAVVTFGPLSRVALAFMVPLALGGVVAFAIGPGAYAIPAIILTASYVLVLMRAAKANEQMFIAKIEGEMALRESADTVRLLLHDYESQTADWLWSVDSGGRIQEPCARFAQASARSGQVLAGLPLVALFDAERERAMLEEHLATSCSFRDLTLRLTLDGAPHWWTLSARPHKDGGMRGVASDVTAQKRAEARVTHMAHYCGLTDLANRFLFNDVLARQIKRMRKGDTLAVLCLDLDQFKSVNDTLGHPIGDKLLCEVARRLEQVAGPNDVVARLGGDEFAMLLRLRSGSSRACRVAEAALTSLARPFMLDGMQVMSSASIGISLAEPGLSADDMVKRADLALYSAKFNGRNRYAHFEPGMDKAAHERRVLEMDLRAALVRNEFELHYQPLLNVESGKVVSYEALVRWNHPRRGVVLPATFIPLAEETGLIVQLGEWVIRQAVSQLGEWPEPLRMSINVSPAQMRSANLITTIVQAIARAGVDPARVEIEITESVLMHDSEVNLAILHKLHDLGVRISLDDFGTGYSSLNYLRSFPFDKIKIDRCFVEDIDTREDCRAIVRAVTTLADSLGMTTTAEGVENDRQLAQIRAEGCTEVQGYLFSTPTPVSELTDLRPARTIPSVATLSPTPKPFANGERDNRRNGRTVRRRRSA